MIIGSEQKTGNKNIIQEKNQRDQGNSGQATALVCKPFGCYSQIMSCHEHAYASLT